MKTLKKVILPVLLVALCMSALIGCGGANHKSPRDLAKSYFDTTRSITEINEGAYNKLLDFYYFETTAQKDAAKALIKVFVESAKSMGAAVEMTAEQKAEAKSAKFVSYTKLIGVDGVSETGKIEFTYKKDGKGDEITDSEEIEMICKDGKWYLAGSFDLTGL